MAARRGGDLAAVVIDGGKKWYQDYKTRAQFPRLTAPTARGMLGVIHRKEADIKLPKALEKYWEKYTPDRVPLETLHKRVTWEILSPGRSLSPGLVSMWRANKQRVGYP